MEKEKKKTLFNMKVEETDKGITVTCEGDACKDIMEKMKKGQVMCMPCGTQTGCCTTICVPATKEKEQ